MIHNFDEKLTFSLGAHEKFDIEILKRIYEYADIIKTKEEVDKTGIDYIATLQKGGTINIDAKTRVTGASKYWKYGEPELALEIWNVMPSETTSGKIGWTLDEASNVDYILYTFDKTDTDKFFYFPFQMLRVAFKKNYYDWCKKYGKKTERSERKNKDDWKSQAVFVPASVVIAEINKQMTGIAYL